jgi:hypothetical protein
MYLWQVNDENGDLIKSRFTDISFTAVFKTTIHTALIQYIKGRPTQQITVDYSNCCTLLYLDTSTVISYLHLFSVTCPIHTF